MHFNIIILVFYRQVMPEEMIPVKIIKDDAPFPLAWFEI
jgi:hypothetical protein